MDLLVRLFTLNIDFKLPGSNDTYCSAEVFPTGIRSICLIFTTCTQWLGQFIIAYSTPYMLANITYGTFLFFASSVVCGVTMVYFLMPETKGFSLEEMDVLFSINGLAINKHRKAENIIAEQREAEQRVAEEEKAAVQHADSTSV